MDDMDSLSIGKVQDIAAALGEDVIVAPILGRFLAVRHSETIAYCWILSVLGRSRFPLMLSRWPPAHMTRGDGGLDESHCFDHAPSLNSGRPADPTIDST